MKTQKVRLDDLLIKKGIAESKSLAQSLIISGRIYLGEKKLDKPGHAISGESNIIYRGPLHPWVSRGGIKLAHALKIFKLSVKGLTALDVGSSTGGFTDVLLQNGAEKIYAVDVGYGQLHEKLLNNSKVISMERKNARYLNAKDITQLIDILVCDASFISLKKILPEFEVGKKNISRGGIVKDEELRKKCCEEIRLWFENIMKWNVNSIIESPIRGPKGNVEYLIYANK